jgi:hypothetical protein
LWDGLEAFSTWHALKQAILDHFLPLAQDKHVKQLLSLRFRPGTGRVFRRTFHQHLALLDAHYTPNPSHLLKHLQSVQYPRLAAIASVFMNGTAKWLPEQWADLLDAMVEADTVLAETVPAPTTLAADQDNRRPPNSSDPRNSQQPPAAEQRRGGKRSRPSGSKPHLPARKRNGPPPTSQAAGAGVRPSGKKPSARPQASGSGLDDAALEASRARFQGIEWVDPAVQAAAREGRCVNCLKPGHISRFCPEPKVSRAKRVATPGQMPKNV